MFYCTSGEYWYVHMILGYGHDHRSNCGSRFHTNNGEKGSSFSFGTGNHEQQENNNNEKLVVLHLQFTQQLSWFFSVCVLVAVIHILQLRVSNQHTGLSFVDINIGPIFHWCSLDGHGKNIIYWTNQGQPVHPQRNAIKFKKRVGERSKSREMMAMINEPHQDWQATWCDCTRVISMCSKCGLHAKVVKETYSSILCD